MWRNRIGHLLLGGIKKWLTHFGKSVAWSLTKTNMRFTIQPSSCPLGIYPSKMKIYVHIKTCTCMFTAALLVKAKH